MTMYAKVGRCVNLLQCFDVITKQNQVCVIT